jgi:two-component system, cell cycle sensor histidine kinase and response regulator CckA
VSTILFVDDHHAFRTVFAEILRTAGHTVLEAGTAAEAERVLERNSGPVDLLLVEAVLTTANGLAIVRRIQPRRPEMCVLFVSKQSAEELTKEGLLPHGAHFMQRPLIAQQLTATLRNLLETKSG